MNMNWAKATPNDIEAACRLNQILDSMSRGEYPATIEEMEAESVPRWFDEDQMPHLRALYDRIQGTLESAPGYQGRILGAMCFAILYPGNELLDPDSDTLEKHPKIVEGLADSDRLLWLLSQMPADALRALVGAVGATADMTELRQRIDSRMGLKSEVVEPAAAEGVRAGGEATHSPRVVAFDGDWHWVRRTGTSEEMSRWVPAQRERGHWNSATWSGVPMSEIEVGERLQHATAQAGPSPAQANNVVYLHPPQMPLP
ncbi:hypothetical protein [Acidovorax sp.]|uniref:hypothetical protein n=1 Tax=Acidovorax sp. TaxID=1872122 RepID=UPI00391EE1F2